MIQMEKAIHQRRLIIHFIVTTCQDFPLIPELGWWWLIDNDVCILQESGFASIVESQ
jgi:hypothetical protein